MDNEPFYLEKRRYLRCLSLSRKEGACQVCPAHNDGEVMSSACIESVMAQAAAALKEYACNGGGI